jgi:hypothetical protein
MRKERSQGHFDVSGGFCFIFQQGPKNEAKSEALWQCGVPVFFSFRLGGRLLDGWRRGSGFQLTQQFRVAVEQSEEVKHGSHGLGLASKNPKPRTAKGLHFLCGA